MANGSTLTKYTSAVTIVTADVANAWYGGLFGSPQAANLPADDPRVVGHIHDGQHIDGHAGKIDLVDHVTGQLRNVNLADDAVTVRNIRGFEDPNDAIPVSEIIGSTEFFYLNIPSGGGGSTDLQGAYDLGNEITIPNGGNRVIINTPSNVGGLLVEHQDSTLEPGVHVNCQNSGSQGVLVEVRDAPVSQVILGDGRSTGGASGGSCTGYFARFASAAETDQAVVFITNESGADNQPTLRLNQASSADALEVNGTSLLNDDVVVAGDILPATTDTHNLGSTTFEWSNLYLNSTIFFDGFGALNTQASLFVDNAANADTIFREGTNEWLRLDSSEDTINFSNSGIVNSDGTSMTIQCLGDPGTIILDAGSNSDVVLQQNGTEWLRFNSAQDGMGFVNAGLITSQAGLDITLPTAGDLNLVVSNGEIGLDSASNLDIVGNPVDISSGSGATLSAQSSVLISSNTDDITMAVAANQDFRFRVNSQTVAAIDGSVSGEPLVLADSNADGNIANVGNKLYITTSGGTSNAVSEMISTAAVAGPTTANILRLSYSNRANPQSAQTFLAFNDSGGEIGDISGDGAGGVTYSPFTGAHKGHFDLAVDEETLLVGMILSSTGKLAGKTYSPEVEVSNIDGDSRVAGVYVGAEDSLGLSGYLSDRRIAIYNAVGDGYILVTDKNGEVQNGDLIESSSIAGYGQKQSDDIFRSKTVAKCTQDVDWNVIEDTIDGYKYAIVSCTYHCG